MRTTTFLSFLYALAVTLADYQCPNNQTSCTIICGNHPSNIQCESSLISASSITTELTILCPYLSSCRNMTTICPVGNNTKCQISCTDSLSCDRTTIHSESTETVLNCISSDIYKEDICTNNITIHLYGNNSTILCALNATNTNRTTVRVCDGITVTTNNTVYSSGDPSLLTFECDGNGIQCNDITITAPNSTTLNITANGALNDSIFINNNNMNIMMGDRALVSLSTFIGTAMGQGSSVSISMANGSVSRSNTFMFNDLSTFEMVTALSTDCALFTESNITITNDMGISQTVAVEGIVADGTNHLTAQQANLFTLECRNNHTKCGSLGIIDVMEAFEVRVTIGSGVTFGSIINAGGVSGVNAIITVLEGAILDGFTLKAASAGQITFDVYGETRGKNLIDGSGAMGFAVHCRGPKSCTGELEFMVRPGWYTDIHCVGTGCDMMTLNVPSSADELLISISKEDCPCEEERRTLCITEWDIKCETNKTSKVIHGECDGDCCDGIIKQMQQTYSNKYECPVRANKTMYICQEGEECNIDCKNTTQYDMNVLFECSSAGAIDASMAGSLSVLCSKDAVCSDLNILCPDDRLCGVNCDGDCKDLNIVGNASRVLFECIDSSCSSLDLDNNRGNISIYSNSGGIIDNLRVLSPVIDVIKVRNDGGIIDKLNIKPVNAINKVSVDITGTLSNSIIDATKANNLSVICSNVMDGFCSNVTLMIGVSDDAVSSLLCRNEGCQDMVFYTVNDMDDLNLSLTACRCSEAIKSSCVRGGNEWSIYCEANKNGEASVFAKNKCDGVCCGDVVEDMRLKECDYSGGSKKKYHPGAGVVVVCSFILVLVLVVLVGSVVYYFKKKKKKDEAEVVLLVND